MTANYASTPAAFHARTKTLADSPAKPQGFESHARMQSGGKLDRAEGGLPMFNGNSA
jgi:hypothetical protein